MNPFKPFSEESLERVFHLEDRRPVTPLSNPLFPSQACPKGPFPPPASTRIGTTSLSATNGPACPSRASHHHRWGFPCCVGPPFIYMPSTCNDVVGNGGGLPRLTTALQRTTKRPRFRYGCYRLKQPLRLSASAPFHGAQSAISRQQKPVSDTAWRFQCHCVGNHKGYPYEFVGEWKMSWSGAVHIRALLGMSSPQVAMGIRIEIRSHGFGIVCRS